METLLSNAEKSSQHRELPFKKSVIAKAVEDIINPSSYTVQEGDTIEIVSKKLGIMPPMSLFNVKQGQVWQVAHGFMYNPKTGTSFPVRTANNDHRFTLAA